MVGHKYCGRVYKHLSSTCLLLYTLCMDVRTYWEPKHSNTFGTSSNSRFSTAVSTNGSKANLIARESENCTEENEQKWTKKPKNKSRLIYEHQYTMYRRQTPEPRATSLWTHLYLAKFSLIGHERRLCVQPNNELNQIIQKKAKHGQKMRERVRERGEEEQEKRSNKLLTVFYP